MKQRRYGFWPRTLLIALALMCVVSCTPAEPSDDPTSEDETSAPEMLPLADAQGNSIYAVVRPELDVTETTVNAAVAVRQALEELLSCKVRIATDWEKDPDEAEIAARYEILVGETNRPESAAALEGLGELDYVIRADGNKIVLLGGSERATKQACEVFIMTYLTDATGFPKVLDVKGQCEKLLEGAQLVRTVYPTEDSVVADILPYEMEYDVDPTGVEDSTRGIQEALNDCAALGGGTVFLTVGKYRVTKTITVPAMVTLRGDWQDPDTGNDYGTVLLCDVDRSTSILLACGSAGVRGLTFYYPHQSAEQPKDLGWAIEFARDDSQCANVLDITLINAYNGIGYCQPPYQIAACSNGWFRNIKGTALNTGFCIYNNSGACSYELMRFSPDYWLQAGAEYNAPDEQTLRTYLRENATAYILGDLEMPLIYRLEADGCKYGIYIADGQRFKFWGSGMSELNITDCDIAMYIEAHYPSRMSGIVRSTLEGSEGSIIMAEDAPKATILVTDCILSHDPEGDRFVVTNEDDSEEAYTPYTGTPRATGIFFANVLSAPYNAPSIAMNEKGKFPTEDATPAIQAALDAAGKAGGGVVYLPAGMYRIDGYLTVPAGVELRGAGSIPMAPGPLGGTLLCVHSGKEPDDPYTAQATITVAGEGAGVRNLQFIYPDNPFANPSVSDPVPYSFTIRLDAADCYVSDTFFCNPYLAIDCTENADDHYVKRLGGTFARILVRVGACSGGWLESFHDINPTYWTHGYARFGLPGDAWLNWGEDAAGMMAYQQNNSDMIVIEGARNEYILDMLQFGGGELIVVKDGSVEAWNVSIDQGGYSCVTMEGGFLTGMNVQRTFSGKDGDIVLRGDKYSAAITNLFHLY